VLKSIYLIMAEKRAVWVERVWMKGIGACLTRATHYAVRVGHPETGDCYEVEQEGKPNKIMSINGLELNGEPKKAKEIKGTLTLSGSTLKNDISILEFNKNWSTRYPTYVLLGANCQKYARDCLEFLVEGSYEGPCPLPQADWGAWHCSKGSHRVEEAGVWHRKWTAGKIGAIFMIFGFEAEGPKIASGGSKEYYYENWGSFIEVSLFRIEAKFVPLRARIDLNVNTGFGMRDGQFQAKLVGFGISIGNNGVGVSTPVVGLGLGKF